MDAVVVETNSRRLQSHFRRGKGLGVRFRISVSLPLPVKRALHNLGMRSEQRRNPESRARKRALNKVPHLNPLPTGEGKRRSSSAAGRGGYGPHLLLLSSPFQG